MLEEKDFVMVETRELTCDGCCFGLTNRCDRPDNFKYCGEFDEKSNKHFIYKRADDEHTTS